MTDFRVLCHRAFQEPGRSPSTDIEYARYVGARTLKALSKCTTFVRVTQQINEVYGRSV
ncbi:MAG: hypothetical protein LC098_00455 [Burkholderiales bacterium]|nr:hypothetical protein [Burkholderiales bacterium]